MLGSESSWFQVFVHTAMAGRMNQACLDTRAGPPWRWAPGIYLGVWPDGYVGGPVVKRGACASLRGSISVNNQCFKILAKIRAEEHLSERRESRIGPEVRPGVWEERRIWTSQVIITPVALRQDKGRGHQARSAPNEEGEARGRILQRAKWRGGLL